MPRFHGVLRVTARLSTSRPQAIAVQVEVGIVINEITFTRDRRFAQIFALNETGSRARFPNLVCDTATTRPY